jgi:ribosome maturation factor RimP
MDLKQRIKDIVLQQINDDKLFLVDVIISSAGGAGNKVLILVDGDEGVNIDICAQISRKTGNIIEEENLIQDNYNLVVSSPGLEHPLQLHRQYVKNTGRSVKVVLKNEEIITGKLLKTTQTSILVGQEIKEKNKKTTIKEVEIPFTEIKKTNVLVSFK